MKSINCELVLSPALFPYRELKECRTVVVDVLRATSSICAALQAGAEEIVPLDSLEPLPTFREKGYTLAAERNGKKVGGAECGNSPTEYMKMDLHGKRLAYSTTNGTVGLIRAAEESVETLAGCFGNISILSRYMQETGGDWVIMCSGWKNGVSIEDTLFSGALIAELGQACHIVNDAGNMALSLYRHIGEADLYNYCQRGTHIQRLQKMGCFEDIRFVFERDTCPVIPKLENGGIRNYFL